MSCGCGCGGAPSGGDFLPGHDAKLRAELEQRMGQLTNRSALFALRDLVGLVEEIRTGRLTDKELAERIRKL